MNMEFEPSKENIQPLRGGRNVTQLEVALQAQTDSEFQQELIHQKEAFEEAIRSYDGDDPLDNWYNYISWVEQSYPKHGHEGNLVALLEDCLSKFEHDERYMQDRRLCKLWIKFIDFQQNPVELFQLLHYKGICVSCADLYRAWAYYHEIAEDNKRADAIYQLGISAFAQPYEDLLTAHQNFFSAIGRQLIHGIDERRLVEQRHALTSLRTYKHKRRAMVPSLRTGSQVLHETPGVLKENATKAAKSASNVPIVLYEDNGASGSGVAAVAAPHSILDVARKQIVQKENALKPTPWNYKKNIITPKVPTHRTTSFKVHEDEATHQGIVLPPNFAPMNHDDYSEWKVWICFPSDPDPNQVPMYPKQLVYSDPNVEYSLEEIRARKYLKPKNFPTHSIVEEHETFMDTNHGLISVTEHSIPSTSAADTWNQMDECSAQAGPSQLLYAQELRKSFQPLSSSVNAMSTKQSFLVEEKAKDGFQIYQDDHQLKEKSPKRPVVENVPRHSVYQKQPFGFSTTATTLPPPICPPVVGEKMFQESAENNTLCADYTVNMKEAMKDINEMWRDTIPAIEEQQPIIEVQKPIIPKFQIHEDTNIEAANTSSIPNSKMQYASQPEPIISLPFKPKPKALSQPPTFSTFNETQHFNDSCNTQMFNYNIHQQSTPFNLKKTVVAHKSAVNLEFPFNDSLEQSKHMVDEEMRKTEQSTADEKLSVILETTKEYRSSSSSSCSGGTTLKTTIFNTRESLRPIPESTSTYNMYCSTEEQTINDGDANTANNNGYSMLKNLLRCDSNDENKLQSSENSNNDYSIKRDQEEKMEVDENYFMNKMDNGAALDESVLQNVVDPFNPRLISYLLNKIGFPKPEYSDAFIQLQSLPRLFAKKDVITLGDEKYIVEKVIGKGAFGSVYKATNQTTREAVAMKYQKPPNKWEYYIVKEIQKRVNQFMISAYMDASYCYISPTASILITQFYKLGSLLDLTNKIKTNTGKGLKELVAIYYANEIITIVNTLHQCQIIHADIKPDNFLVTRMPPEFGRPSLQLIDFGCSIDMSLLLPHTAFTKCISTNSFTCTEMKDGKPWTYQTDIFCIAATTHVMLFDKYMEVKKTGDIWSIMQRIPRYMRTDLWNTFFFQLLNIDGCDKLPDLKSIQAQFDSILSAQSEELQIDLRFVANNIL